MSEHDYQHEKLMIDEHINFYGDTTLLSGMHTVQPVAGEKGKKVKSGEGQVWVGNILSTPQVRCYVKEPDLKREEIADLILPKKVITKWEAVRRAGIPTYEWIGASNTRLYIPDLSKRGEVLNGTQIQNWARGKINEIPEWLNYETLQIYIEQIRELGSKIFETELMLTGADFLFFLQDKTIIFGDLGQGISDKSAKDYIPPKEGQIPKSLHVYLYQLNDLAAKVKRTS